MEIVPLDKLTLRTHTELRAYRTELLPSLYKLFNRGLSTPNLVSKCFLGHFQTLPISHVSRKNPEHLFRARRLNLGVDLSSTYRTPYDGDVTW